jgi:LysR family transcriptional regulator, benzoate and cis,cis-muconate-responsive activator of ben and cat genes
VGLSYLSRNNNRLLQCPEILILLSLMPAKYQFNFDLRHLIYFRAVAELLHFRKAAESLAIAQPALSRQIAQLEKTLGVTLFNRTQRQVELTPAGKILLSRLEPILQSLQRIPAELLSMSKGEIGHVKVAFTGLAMATVLPELIRIFSKRHPGIRIELNESPTSSQMDALRAGDIDCGFFHPENRMPLEFATRLLLREKNGILLPKEHVLSHRSILRLKDFVDTPFVLFPRHLNPGFYDRILAACTKAGITLKIAEEVWPRANGIGLVCAGLGVTFITPSEAKNLPTEVVFRELEGPSPESRLVAGWRTDSITNPAVAAFVSIVTAQTKK